MSASQSTTRRRVDVRLRETTPPLSCSGGMYAILPLTWPSRVVWMRPAAFATPKSSTRDVPSEPTRMFCGETSRWTMPSARPCSSLASCAAWRPWSTDEMIVAATRGGMGMFVAYAVFISLESDSPATYSMTRKISPSVATTSSVGTTFG